MLVLRIFKYNILNNNKPVDDLSSSVISSSLISLSVILRCFSESCFQSLICFVECETNKFRLAACFHSTVFMFVHLNSGISLPEAFFSLTYDVKGTFNLWGVPFSINFLYAFWSLPSCFFCDFMSSSGYSVLYGVNSNFIKCLYWEILIQNIVVLS